MRTAALLFALATAGTLTACTPTVRLEPSDKPIRIDLNVNMNITQEVRIRVEREVESLIANNPDLF